MESLCCPSHINKCDSTKVMQQDEKQSRKRKKEDVAVVFDAVRGVIHQWDPYSLLALGCPTDEFDAEIQAVA